MTRCVGQKKYRKWNAEFYFVCFIYVCVLGWSTCSVCFWPSNRWKHDAIILKPNVISILPNIRHWRGPFSNSRSSWTMTLRFFCFFYQFAICLFQESTSFGKKWKYSYTCTAKADDNFIQPLLMKQIIICFKHIIYYFVGVPMQHKPILGRISFLGQHQA